MIICDTSGILAALDSAHRLHRSALMVLETDPGPFLLSPFVLAELDYLLSTRVRPSASLAFLDEVARGAYQLEPFSAADVRRATTIMGRYEDLAIGLADASNVVLADRHDVDRVLTLDERHFRTLRTSAGGAFRLLPTDEHPL